MTFIFDFDQTIADTSKLEHFRKQRQWQTINSNIHLVKVYQNMISIIQQLRDNNIKVAVVTTSPKKYCQNALTHLQVDVDCIVGYHCTTFKKPNPQPILHAMDMLKSERLNSIGFGDTATDIIAYKSAGIKSVACTWGCIDVPSLRMSNPSAVITNPLEILSFMKINNS